MHKLIYSKLVLDKICMFKTLFTQRKQFKFRIGSLKQIASYNKIVGQVQRHCHETKDLVRFRSFRNKDCQVNSNQCKSAKKKVTKATSLDYRGMTLKDYFRLSEIGTCGGQLEIKETQQQNACSSKEAVTPCFNQYNGRQKIKTEVYEDKSFIEDKPSFLQKQKIRQIFPFENKTKNLKVQKLPNEIRPKKDSKNTRIKRAITLGAAYKDHLNRSTITSFYQLESKKKKMLDKVKYEKERVNQLKLSDAFFITKYAQKFHIQPHNAF